MEALHTPERKALMTIEDLSSLLSAHRISTDSWGVGEAKTVDDLLAEINNGEARLVEENGELIRITQGLAVNVYCVINGEVWKLKEQKQVFSDGRVRERSGDAMDTSLGEKLKEGEDTQAALMRAVQEELSLPGHIDLKSGGGELREKTRDSNSFPGLKSKHQLHYYDVLLPEDYFKSEGYVETQPTKSTYFIWEHADALPESIDPLKGSSEYQPSV